MIKTFGGENCWCFKDRFEIELGINNNAPKEYGFKEIGIVPIMGLIGANASGKTNALRVLSFIKEFCVNSFNNKPNGEIAYYSYFDNSKKSYFFVEFYLENNYTDKYKYELEIDTHNVYNESITINNLKSKKYLLKRVNNKITINRLFSNKTKVILRNNASFISTFYQYEITEINGIFNFFNSIKSNVTLYETYNEPNEEIDSKYYYEHSKMLKRVTKEISKFDTGVIDINVNKYKIPNSEKNQDVYMSIFTHEVYDGEKTLPIYLQSTGTRTLFSYLPDILSTIDSGGVLIFDEIECHLHPNISLEIIKYFTNKESNKKQAQLIFTTHDQNILDSMKKYNIYIFNKEKGESYCYRIDEIKDNGFIRNDKSIQSLYKQGLLGGLPNVRK